MVTLPPTFVMTRAPGYFWNLETKKLYSIKSGLLKPLAFRPAGYFNRHKVEAGYKVSVNGVKRTLTLAYLNTLTLPNKPQVVKVQNV